MDNHWKWVREALSALTVKCYSISWTLGKQLCVKPCNWRGAIEVGNWTWLSGLYGREHTGDFVMQFCSTTVEQQNPPCVLTAARLAASPHTRGILPRDSVVLYCKIERQSRLCVSRPVSHKSGNWYVYLICYKRNKIHQVGRWFSCSTKFGVAAIKDQEPLKFPGHMDAKGSQWQLLCYYDWWQLRSREFKRCDCQTQDPVADIDCNTASYLPQEGNKGFTH